MDSQYTKTQTRFDFIFSSYKRVDNTTVESNSNQLWIL